MFVFIKTKSKSMDYIILIDLIYSSIFDWIEAGGGFTITRGNSRLKSELSFTGGGQECLSRISENVVDYASAAAAAGNGSLHTNSTNTWGGGGPDNNNNSNSIVFSSSQTQTNNNSKKRSSRTDPNDDPDLLLHCLNALETQVLSLFTILILHPQPHYFIF